MTNRVYVGRGLVFIDASKTPPDGRLKKNTRLSICLNGDYVAIMEVNLPEGVELRAGAEHTIPVRMLAGQDLEIGVDYEVRNPIYPIGRLRLTALSPEGDL